MIRHFLETATARLQGTHLQKAWARRHDSTLPSASSCRLLPSVASFCPAVIPHPSFFRFIHPHPPLLTSHASWKRWARKLTQYRRTTFRRPWSCPERKHPFERLPRSHIQLAHQKLCCVTPTLHSARQGAADPAWSKLEQARLITHQAQSPVRHFRD